MHKLIEYVCDELEELEKKADKEGNLSMSEVEYADKLAHLKKNLLKSEEMMESDYSSKYSMARGRNAKRDAMGRYSKRMYYNNRDMADTLYSMMDDMPDDARRDAQKLANRLEKM